jgi:ribosomal protein S10
MMRKLLDQSAEKIVTTTNRSGAKIAGPIPLPTKIEKFCVLDLPMLIRSQGSSLKLGLTKG